MSNHARLKVTCACGALIDVEGYGPLIASQATEFQQRHRECEARAHEPKQPVRSQLSEIEGLGEKVASLWAEREHAVAHPPPGQSWCACPG